MTDFQWIAFDGNDYETFGTKKEAVAWAEDALREYRALAIEGWPDEVTRIVVARVVVSVVETERRPVEPGDQCQGCDEFADYALVRHPEV